MRTDHLGFFICAILSTALWCDQSVVAQPDFSHTNVSPGTDTMSPWLQASVETTKAAKKGKQALEHLTKNDDRHARELGFSSAAEAVDTKTALGDPLPRFLVPLNKLKAYEPGGVNDARSLLQPANDFIYPITVGEGKDVRSSLTVTGIRKDHQASLEWRTTEWGGAGIIRLLEKHRTSTTNLLVWIPSLNRYFLGILTVEEFLIIPIIDEPRLGFTAGQSLSATDAFANLLTEAKASDGKPH